MARALANEGAALLEDGRAEEAVEVLRRAVAGGDPTAPDLLIRAYLATGHWHCVVDWLGPLVEGGALEYAGRLGVALDGLGDAERAEGAFRTAIAAGDVAAANDLAILLRDQGRLGEAARVLARAADAGDPQAGANLTSVLLEARDLAGAVTAARRYLDETRPDTLVALGDVRVAQGRLDEAGPLYERAVALGALRAHTAYAGFLLEHRNDVEGAERELRAAGEAGEPGWAAHLGRFLIDVGRGREAREYLRLAVASGDASAVTTLAELDGEDPYED